MSCCSAKASSTVSILPQPPRLGFFPLILPLRLCLCGLLFHSSSHSLARFYSRCLSARLRAPISSVFMNFSAPLPAPRSAHAPRRAVPAGVPCSRDTAGSSPAAAREPRIGSGTGAWALGPERGRSEPAQAAGAAARKARPPQPHSPVPAPHGPVRNGGSEGGGGRGLRAALLPAVPHLAGGFRSSTDGLGTLVPRVVTSSTMLRSALRERLGVERVKEQRRAVFMAASPRGGREALRWCQTQRRGNWAASLAPG